MPFSTPMPGFSREVEESLLGGSLASMRWISGMDYASFGRDRTAEEDRAQGDDTALARWSTPDMQASNNNDTQGGSDAGGSQGGGFSSIYAAQTEATNAILTSLGQGNYEGNEDQFHHDLESIQNWDNAGWIDPTHTDCSSRYVPPWDSPSVLDECFREGSRSTMDEICLPPCSQPREFVSEARVSSLTADLNIDYGSVTNAREELEDLESLIRDAWALLADNEDVVRWIICTLSQDPADGDCLTRMLDQQDVKIKYQAGASPSLSVTTDVRIEFDWPDFFPLQMFKINVFISSAFVTNSLGAHRAGGDNKICGTIAMAAGLLHELSHICVRDTGDALFARTCPFSTQLEKSFIWAMIHSFPQALNSTCCSSSYGAGLSAQSVDRLWWAGGEAVDPTSSCF